MLKLPTHSGFHDLFLNSIWVSSVIHWMDNFVSLVIYWIYKLCITSFISNLGINVDILNEQSLYHQFYVKSWYQRWHIEWTIFVSPVVCFISNLGITSDTLKGQLCITSDIYRLLHGIFHIIPFISPRSWYQPESR